MITLNEIAYNIKNLAYGGSHSTEESISLRQIKSWIHYHRAKIISDNLNRGMLTNHNLFQVYDLSAYTLFDKVVTEGDYPNQSSFIRVEVAQAVTDTSLAELSASVSATGDPATLFVQYTENPSGLSGTVPVRFTPGENLTSGDTLVTVQSTNTTANPATGQGTLISNGSGDFFVRGHFVFAKEQSILLRK